MQRIERNESESIEVAELARLLAHVLRRKGKSPKPEVSFTPSMDGPRWRRRRCRVVLLVRRDPASEEPADPLARLA